MTPFLTGTGSDSYRQTAADSGQAAAGSRGSLVNKDDFLKLLVAQIKNQNPLNPADGIEFLTQLAQFSQLEQLINIRQMLETALDGGPAPDGAAGK